MNTSLKESQVNTNKQLKEIIIVQDLQMETETIKHKQKEFWQL